MAAHAAGRVLQIQAIGEIVIYLIIMGSIGFFIKSIPFDTCDNKEEKDNLACARLALMAILFAGAITGLVNVSVIAAACSPDLALAARVLEALPK